MANVDLLRDAYRNSLGREASDEELRGWESGQFGGGGVNDWVNQIAQSPEAQQRQPQQTPVLNQQPNVSRPQDNSSGPDDYFNSQLSGAYQNYLGRQASPDELNSWWSGGFGHGSGMSGIGAFQEAIRNSGEAKTRNSGTAPQPFHMNTDYWGTQGVRPEDIFDTATGQIRPGWQRTAKGYERIGGTTGTTTTGGGNNSDLQAWIRSQLTGASSPQALAALESTLAQRGIRLQKDSAGNVRGRLFLPDGSTVDVVNQWGQPWTWNDRGTGAGGVGGGQIPGNQYGDPYTQFLEMLIKSRIGSLQGGYDDSQRQQYMNALQGRANALGQGNQQLDQLMKYLQDRFTDLKGPGYTGAENEVLRTGALDPIEQDRAAARKRVLEQISARGITPDSGIAQQLMQEVDKQFDAIRGVSQTQLATNELGRRENRNQRAEAIGAQLADIPDQRAREQLDVFSALENLSLLARNEDEARSREAIQYGGVLSDLGPQRLQLAMQAAGMGGNPSSLGSILTNIAGLNQNASQFNANNSNALWSGLGSLAAIIARSGRSGVSGVGI